jgi:TonB family protein
MLELLLAVSLRILVLAGVGGVAAARITSAAARHAVWSLVTGGMLVLGLAIATLPVVPVRVVARAVRPLQVTLTTAVPLPAVTRAAPAPARPFPWGGLITAIYAMGVAAFGVRLAYGYGLTRKLAMGSRRIARFEGEAVYECPYVSVPLTVGWLRPTILLPAGWDAWAPEKLTAVLVHERHHVRRSDWAIAVLAGINRCVFWFHPLAWWLEAQLRTLAELACDDESVGQVESREFYAQVLVEIAAAVRAGEGRVGWDAMTMAKGAEVRMRVERILDEGREISTAMTRGRWVLLAVGAIPVIYFCAVMRPARVRAQDPVAQSPVIHASMTQAPPGVYAPVMQAPATQRVETSGRTEDADLKAAQAALERAEQEFVNFKSQNMGRLPEQFQANVVQLNSLQMMVGQANEALSQLQQTKLMLETQLQNLNTELRFNSSTDSVTEKVAEERVRALQTRLAAASETLTPKNPSIKRLQEELEAAEQLRAAAKQTDPQKQRAAIQLEGSMNVTKTEIQNLNLQMDEKVKQAADLRRQIASYQNRIEGGPQLESQYAQLQRGLAIAEERLTLLRVRSDGQIQVSVTFGKDGRPQHVRVLHGHGSVEDEKAIEWVKALRFVPPAKNGETVTITVEVPAR